MEEEEKEEQQRQSTRWKVERGRADNDARGMTTTARMLLQMGGGDGGARSTRGSSDREDKVNASMGRRRDELRGDFLCRHCRHRRRCQCS